jgi:hypothetical protein
MPFSSSRPCRTAECYQIVSPWHKSQHVRCLLDSARQRSGCGHQLPVERSPDQGYLRSVTCPAALRGPVATRVPDATAGSAAPQEAEAARATGPEGRRGWTWKGPSHPVDNERRSRGLRDAFGSKDAWAPSSRAPVIDYAYRGQPGAGSGGPGRCPWRSGGEAGQRNLRAARHRYGLMPDVNRASRGRNE